MTLLEVNHGRITGAGKLSPLNRRGNSEEEGRLGEMQGRRRSSPVALVDLVFIAGPFRSP